VKGWIYPSISSGETFTEGSDTYLVFSQRARGDAYSFSGRKTNCEVSILERTETTDSEGVVTPSWSVKASSEPVCGEIVTSALRQAEPGLLNTTVRVYYVPSSVEVAILSRLVHEMAQEEAVDMGAVYDSTYGGARFKVDSIDDLILTGVKRLQCSNDERGD
jgi:hypothetical protein